MMSLQSVVRTVMVAAHAPAVACLCKRAGFTVRHNRIVEPLELFDHVFHTILSSRLSVGGEAKVYLTRPHHN